MKGIIKDIVIVAACVAVIWIGLTAYFGAQNPFYVVSSGSMYPELAMYDIIVISGHISFDNIKIGDIIVFDRPKDHDKVIVHRVVAVVDDDPKTLRTKGDNNQQSMVGTDYPITDKEYIGKVVYKSMETKSVLDDYSESQPNETIDTPNDTEYVEPKDFTTQENKSTENSDQEKKVEDVPEFFSDKEKEFEEK